MFEAKLRMRLESGEPKCANCVYWDNDPKMPTFGICRLFVDSATVAAGVELISELVAMTTDLQLCSKWQGKD